MPHSVTCGACKATFSIPDDVWEKRVQGQIATLKCRHCKSPIEVDGRVRRGSAASINTSTDAVPAGARSDAKPAVDSPPSPAADGSRHHPAATGPVKRAELARQDAKAGTPKPAQPAPAPTKATHHEPRTTGVSDSGWFGVKQPQPSTTAQRVGGEYAAKPIETGTPSGHRSGEAATKTSPASFATTTAVTAHTNPTGHRTAERGPARPGLPSSTSLRSTQDATPKAKAAAPRGESKFSPGVTDVDKQRDSSDLWVVSFGADDDRELTTVQLQETIAKGQVTRDTIVWREGMTDWLPVVKIPDLAKLLKRDPVAPATNRTAPAAISDDSDEETVIFRPGTRAAAAAAAAGITPPTSPTRAASTGAASGEVAGKPDVPAQRAKLVEPATASRGGSPPMHAPARAAPSIGSAQRIENSTGPSPQSEDAHRTTATPTAAKAAFATAKTAGGPPPLRRAQPSRPGDTAGAATPRATEPHASSMNEVVTSVPHYEPARAAAAPPPLPIKDKPEAPAAKQAIFPPAVQSAPVVDIAPHSLRATPSFVPRPSDVAALTKIRPKFPKWLPFAVLGGLVVAVALLAALSWFGGDNQEDAVRKAAADSTVPLPEGSGRSRTTAASSAVTAPKDAKPSGDLSAGFANQFAQAAAKQRPTARFDKEAAEKALAPGFAKAAGCHNKGEPTGTASATISISPSGQVLSVTVAPPFSTTFTAECIRNALRDISVPPFQGSPGRLAHSITIR